MWWNRSRNEFQQGSGIYYFGGRYFDERSNDSAELSTVFETPPVTTEQLIHGETPASEPVAPLTVEQRDDERWEPVRGRQADGGELLVRRWLHVALPPDRVNAAATGWGNDELLVHGGGTESRNATWVLRWDSTADPEAFDTAVDDLEPTLERRADTDVRHVRVAPETVVVFAGRPSFVDGVSASGTNGSVTVAEP